MQPVRIARLEALIQEELSTIVSRELRDPRIPALLTFTKVELTPAADHAVVSVVMESYGEDSKKAKEECIKALTSAKGFLRKQLSKILTVRQVPDLTFREDRGFENARRVHELLNQISKDSSNPDSRHEH